MAERNDRVSANRISDDVIRFIKSNYQRRVTLHDVARAVCLSPHHMNRRFKEEVGCTVMKYLTRVRIERAKGLLEDENLRISDVMRSVGYTEPSHFTKAFKKAEGIAPMDFRRKGARWSSQGTRAHEERRRVRKSLGFLEEDWRCR